MTKQSEIEYLRGFIRGAELRIQQVIEHELKAINNFGVSANLEVILFDQTRIGANTPKQIAQVILSAEVK